MHRTEEEKRLQLKAVKEEYIDDAIASIENIGRYWVSMNRTLVRVLDDLLNDMGYQVTCYGYPPPIEEHVFILIDQPEEELSLTELGTIAEEKYRLSEQGVDQALLPE